MKSTLMALVTMSLVMFNSLASHAAYDVVSCGSASVFSENSCDQCFSGGSVEVGENKGLLTDDWENADATDQIMFKEEQDMPQIIPLGGATWTEVKASDSVDFWQYTQELEALYDEDNLGYKLGAGERATWIESTLGSAYQLSSNSAAAGSNIGMIVYDLAVHGLDDSGNVELDTTTHRECVLFTSASGDTPPVTPTNPQQPERLPDTGAEHILLAVVALMLGFGFLKFRSRG